MRAGRILKLAGANYISNLPEHHRDIGAKQLNVILDAAEQFNAELAAVQDDEELSPEGRAVEAANVRRSALATLTAVESTTIKTLAERAATLEASLLKKITPPPPKDPADRLAYEMRLGEIRDQLRALPADQRLLAYRTTDDAMLIAAVETAPPTLSATRPDGTKRLEPFVDAEGMQVARLERAKKADPTTAATLAEVKTLHEVYSLAIASVTQEILDEVPGIDVSA